MNKNNNFRIFFSFLFESCNEGNKKYYTWSRQSINRGKSGIFFSKHIGPNSKQAIRQQLNMKRLKKDAVYLGAPMFLSRSPSKDFKFLQDKLLAKLIGWRSKCLSWVGRCTFINSVTQALPTYTLSSFDVPIGNCDKLDSLSRRFWWKPKEKEGRFIAWKGWNKLCQPKCAGGLDFKKTREVNEALLAKLAWMVWLLANRACVWKYCGRRIKSRRTDLEHSQVNLPILHGMQ